MVTRRLRTNLIQDDPRPSITKIYELVFEHHCQITDKFVGVTGVSWRSLQRNLSKENRMKRCSQVCASLARGRSRGVTSECVSWCERNWSELCFFYWKTSPVMEAGFMVTTLLRNQQAIQWKHSMPCPPPKQKWRQVKTSLNSDADLLLRCERNCLHSVSCSWSNCLPDIFAWQFWCICETRQDENVPTSGKLKSGGFITTMCLRTPSWVRDDFFVFCFTKNDRNSFTHPPYSLDLAPVTSHFSSE